MFEDYIQRYVADTGQVAAASCEHVRRAADPADWSRTMTQARKVDTNGYEVAYDVTGAGPAIVLIPGALMGRWWWHDVGYVDRLAGRFTIVCVDPLGHGESDHPHDPAAYTGTRVVADLGAVLDAEGIDRCVMWGFSRGGTITSRFARTFPERVKLAVMGSAPAHGTAFPEAMVEAMLGGDWSPFVELAVIAGLAGEADCQRLVEANDAVAWGAAFRARGEIEWGQFEVPAVGYLGDGEGMREQACSDAQRFGFPMAVLPTGGHLETFTDIDPVMALVEPFLST